jgi:hypothetical protein
LLRLLRVASKREVIRRPWVKDDLILRDLGVPRMAMGTNYAVLAHHAARLVALWFGTGEDWNYADAVAGLWAYQQTYGQEVSRLAGSAVAEVALIIGRVVTCIHNKVVNYRVADWLPQHADPKVVRAGETVAKAITRAERGWPRPALRCRGEPGRLPTRATTLGNHARQTRDYVLSFRAAARSP